MNKTILRKYARLLVDTGLALRKGETLVISAGQEGLELARIVTEYAYRRGAARVELLFGDEAMQRLHYRYQTRDALTSVPAWQIARYDEMADRQVCYLALLGEDPNAFCDVDAALLNDVARARHVALKRYYDATTDNIIRWCLCAVPTRPWARAVFPDLSPAQAERKLWTHILQCMRLDAPDPAAAWRAHSERLRNRANYLNKRRLTALHLRSGLGTDLTVALPQGYRFDGGAERGRNGVAFHPNMPTEEIFTSPHRLGTQGVAVASMPLSHNGTLVRDFRIEFRDGKICSFDAREGADCLAQLIETDEGSHYLGEVALVGADSPIRKQNILYYNTLFDENAACHLAIGQSYPTVAGCESMSEAQRLEIGLNRSHTHVDFMIGTDDMYADGIDADGNRIPILRDGRFVAEAE